VMRGFKVFLETYGAWRLSTANSMAPFLALPGITWAELRLPASQGPEDRHNVIFEGTVEQGIDWVRVPGGGLLNTYAAVDITKDSKEHAYNNSVALGLGVRLKYQVSPGWTIQPGMEAVRDHRWSIGSTRDDILIYLNWYRSWDID